MGDKHPQLDPRRFSGGRALQQPLDGRFELPARNLLFLAGVFELVPTADKGFVGFNAPTHFLERTFLHRQTDTVKHEPACFLGNAKRTSDLVRTDTVLSVDDEPDRREPLAQGQRAIPKDRPDFYRELFFAILAIAHHALAGKRTNVRRAAMSALWPSVWPKNLGQKIVSVLRIGKKRDGFLKGFGSRIFFHVTNIAREELGVKYIITPCVGSVYGPTHSFAAFWNDDSRIVFTVIKTYRQPIAGVAPQSVKSALGELFTHTQINLAVQSLLPSSKRDRQHQLVCQVSYYPN